MGLPLIATDLINAFAVELVRLIYHAAGNRILPLLLVNVVVLKGPLRHDFFTIKPFGGRNFSL